MVAMDRETKRAAYVQFTVRFSERDAQRIDRAVHASGLSAQRYLAIAILMAVQSDEEERVREETNRTN